jgi:hypothetical protein
LTGSGAGDFSGVTGAAVGKLRIRQGISFAQSFVSTVWLFAVLGGMDLHEEPRTLVGVFGSFPRGNAVAGVEKRWTMLPTTSGGLAALPQGRFHVETARLKVFSQALRAFPRGNAISEYYVQH